jgi:hypothetical protein
MIIKITLIGLVLILIAIIFYSYYVNKEGFDDISNIKDITNAINTVTPEFVNQDKQSNNSSTPTRNDVVPEISISGSGYDAMTLQQRAELLKDIQKVVRNEILANRSVSPVIANNNTSTQTDSTAQGKEYENSCHKDTEYRCPKNPDGTCPPLPDMTEYIRKDSIPCWNCSLDY